MWSRMAAIRRGCRGDAKPRADSQGNGLCERRVSHLVAQGPGSCHIDPSVNEFREILGKAERGHELGSNRVALGQLDEEVNVTLDILVAPRQGAE